MAQKVVEIEGIGDVVIRKRRGSKHLRITIASHGKVQVSMPAWTPYSTGISFARSRIDWITTEKSKHLITPFFEGCQIGKAHRVYFKAQAKSVRTMGTQIIAPIDYQSANLTLACDRALKKQAESLLPQRLAYLASKHGFEFKAVQVKKMRSRWGSCSSEQVVALNIYLMQLPWHLIDYVLLHELVHTKHLNHSARFWAELIACMPNAKTIKKELRHYHTQVMPQ